VLIIKVEVKARTSETP